MKIINKRKYFYVISVILLVLSVASISFWGLNLGIDFTGGSLLEIRTGDEFGKNDLQEKLKESEVGNFFIQETASGSFIIRYKSESEETNEKVLAKIKELDENTQELRMDFIGPSISQELKRNALIAVSLAIIGIMFYIAWAFRKVNKPVPSWKYSLGAIAALAHDILITVGAFSLLGKFANLEVGIPFIAALLTILGYSVNDTIVVYDRTRENLIRGKSSKDFEETVDMSLRETIARSINTSLTVVVVLVAIIFFGGSSIQNFSLALLLGVILGTYSSIYIASALLVTTHEWQKKKSSK